MPIKCEARVSNGIVFSHLNEDQPYPEIQEWGHKWEKPVLTYRLNNLSSDIDHATHQIRAVTVAFRVWQLRVRDIKFQREYDPNANVDIHISFQPLSEFNSPGVLAHAYYPGQGEVSGNIEINDEWDWVTNTHVSDLGHPPLVPVLIHEIGHSLGLVHDTIDNGSIMYPSFDLGAKKNELGDRDVERIQWLYGARNLSQRIIDYFRNRRKQGWDFD
jgi:hypothetical protein